MRQDIVNLCSSKNVTYCVEYATAPCPRTCYYSRIQDLAKELNGDVRNPTTEHLTPNQFEEVRRLL